MEVTDKVTLGTAMGDVPGSEPVAWELAFLERVDVFEAVRVRFVVLAEGEGVFRPKSAKVVVSPATWEGPGLEIGCWTFVERIMMSLPCTTRLSLDFFRSNVSISGWSMNTHEFGVSGDTHPDHRAPNLGHR